MVESFLVDRRFLFVITYGRSGSTLLQGVLNSIDGFCICGENNDALSDFFRFYSNMSIGRKNFVCNNMPVDERNSWFNPCSCNRLDRYVFDFLFRLFSSGRQGVHTTGFKGIRWNRHMANSVCSLSELLVWMGDVLDARFIFLSRNHDEVCNSMWHRNKNFVDCKSELELFEDWVGSFISGHPGQDWFWLDVGRLHPRSSVSPERFRGLFEWLGESFDSRRLESVLDVEWGY